MSIGDGEGEDDYHPHPLSNLLLLITVGINCICLAKSCKCRKKRAAMSASVMEKRGAIKCCKFWNASILVGEAAELIDAAAVEPGTRMCGGGEIMQRRMQI
jgi:histidinol phosphatase-like enzyme